MAANLTIPPFSLDRLENDLCAQGAESFLFRSELFETIALSRTHQDNASGKSVTVPTPGGALEPFGPAGRQPGIASALKVRPAKAYRHPVLDRRLTKARLLAEARVLVRCLRDGVRVPRVLAVDWDHGWVGIEWIPGKTVRDCLDWLEQQAGPAVSVATTAEPEVGLEQPAPPENSVDPDGLAEEEQVHRQVDRWRTDRRMVELLIKVGAAVGALHSDGIVHGDLTTSNMLLSAVSVPTADRDGGGAGSVSTESLFPTADGPGLVTEVTLIDFGLASQTQQDEDRAVDLYVLERAFASTHPRLTSLFDELVLPGYLAGFQSGAGGGAAGGKGRAGQNKRAGATGGAGNGRTVLRKLEDVRLRGRKKSMLG